MFVLIENGEVYAPEPLGRQSMLIASGSIAKIGVVDREAVERLGVELEVIDAAGCVVLPGLIDPHEHLLGGSGEDGFSTQTPEFSLSEIVSCGITTVVGCLGVDTTMKTMAGLLAKAKALREEGLTAYIWTGGYNVPPTTILDSVRRDIMYVEEVIGAGEVAISDLRGMDPDPHEMARTVTNAYVGGLLSRKCGLTHVHVGDRERRLQPIRDMLEQFNLEARLFYVTHVERSEKLMREAIALAERGAAVDIDVVEGELPRWLRYYIDQDGDLAQLTVSSDAGVASPSHLCAELRACVRDHGLPLELVFRLATENTARILKLPLKGRLEVGRHGDVLILERGTLDLMHVLARGRSMMRDGELVVREQYLEKSDRTIRLTGAKYDESRC